MEINGKQIFNYFLNFYTNIKSWKNFTSPTIYAMITNKAINQKNPEGKVVWARMVTGESFITNEGRREICDALPTPLHTTELKTLKKTAQRPL